jgi:tRNA dimethylallyltransferase
MLEGGALEEARRLAARELSADLPVMRAVGAAELISHLEGVLSLEEAAELAKRNTRHLAKRQMTWFRNQARAWPVAETRQDALQMILSDISH